MGGLLLFIRFVKVKNFGFLAVIEGEIPQAAILFFPDR